jgi:hypothetical protein
VDPVEGDDDVDILIWLVSTAPQNLRTAFSCPLPESGMILLISAHHVNNIALEAAILARSKETLLARASMPDGSLALLFES